MVACILCLFFFSFLCQKEAWICGKSDSAFPWDHCRHCAAGSKPVQVYPESMWVGFQQELLAFPICHVLTSQGVMECGFLLFVLQLCSKGWFCLQFWKSETKLWTGVRLMVLLISGCFLGHYNQKKDCPPDRPWGCEEQARVPFGHCAWFYNGLILQTTSQGVQVCEVPACWGFQGK